MAAVPVCPRIGCLFPAFHAEPPACGCRLYGEAELARVWAMAVRDPFTSIALVIGAVLLCLALWLYCYGERRFARRK